MKTSGEFTHPQEIQDGNRFGEMDPQWMGAVRIDLFTEESNIEDFG